MNLNDGIDDSGSDSLRDPNGDSVNDVVGSGIDEFLRADRRARHKLLQRLAPLLTPADMPRLAEALHDPSPRTSSRLTALFARHGCRELFERELQKMNSGKAALLRAQFHRIANSQGE